MEIQARAATLADIDQLTHLFDGYRVFYGQSSDLALARSFLRQRIEQNQSRIFVAAKKNGTCCGFTQLFPSFSSVSAQQLWILNDLYVEPEARQQGIGRLLMNRAREFALATRSKGIALETAANNVNAQALYESLGYKKDSTSFFYFLSLE